MRKNILKISFFTGVILNFDKIVFWQFSLIRIHDTFDIGFPFVTALVSNILRYGVVTQFPQMVCGIANAGIPMPLSYTLTQLIFPPYWTYLLHSIGVSVIAFLGMFLLLNDEFKVAEKASFIGALFFVSIHIFLPGDLTVVGIPLLIWVLERIFDNRYSLTKRLLIYSYIIIYFLASSFVWMSFVLMPFYFSYFLFLSRIRKKRSHLFILCLIWCLFLLIHLPRLVEMFAHAIGSHRNVEHVAFGLSDFSWINAAKFFIVEFFSLNMHRFYITMPSLLGLLIIIYYILDSKRTERGRYFYFPIVWIVFIVIFSFFIYQSPFSPKTWKYLGIFRGLNFSRYYFLLVILFAILIGQASDFLMRKGNFSNKKSWLISISLVSLYSLVSFFTLRFHKEFELIPQQFIIQSLCVCIFLILLILKIVKKIKLPGFSILLIPFVVFLIANTIHSKVYFGIENYYHFFNSNQVEKVKEIEKSNLNNFRVVKIAGCWHMSQLLQNGFKCADGYVNIYPQDYKEFWAKVIEPELTKSKEMRDYFLKGGNRVYLFDTVSDNLIRGEAIKELRFNIDLLKLINVKYLFSSRRILSPERYDLIEIAEKNPEYFTVPLWKRYFRKKELYVYQNKDFAPPVFLTDSVNLFDTKKQLLDELGKKEYLYLRNNTFALREDLKGLTFEDLNLSEAAIIDYKLTPDEITVEVDNLHPVILNLTRNYNKNWLCTIDGKEAKIFKIYNTFMGVILPDHSHVVKFKYKNEYLPYACLTSVLGFLIANIFIIKHLRNRVL